VRRQRRNGPVDPLASRWSEQEIERDKKRILAHLAEYLRTGVPSFDLRLNNGRLRGDGKRDLLSQISWMWSEVRGKVVGCPFWSVAAANRLAELAKRFPRWSSLNLGREAQRRIHGPVQLQHEHVYPRKDWKTMIVPHVVLQPLGEDDLRALMHRYCIACIVTKAEHGELPPNGEDRNPWLRYRGTSIRLVPNPSWQPVHHSWIDDAQILGRSAA